jgi:hypothetical protein
LNYLISTSNNFAKKTTLGVPNFEMLQVTSLQVTWYPAQIAPQIGTFEPVAFDLRYMPTKHTDTVLPIGYSGNYNQSHYNVLLQQTAKPVSRLFSLKNMPYMISSSQGKACLGQLMDATHFALNAPNLGGILTIMESTPSLNTVIGYNPKLGFFELKFQIDLYNTIV